MQVISWKDRNPDTVKEVVRGLEIARWNGFTRDWDVVGRFKATELAARQAATETKWLNERHPYELYQLRAVVSFPRGHEPLSNSTSRSDSASPNPPDDSTKETDGQLDTAR